MVPDSTPRHTRRCALGSARALACELVLANQTTIESMSDRSTSGGHGLLFRQVCAVPGQSWHNGLQKVNEPFTARAIIECASGGVKDDGGDADEDGWAGRAGRRRGAVDRTVSASLGRSTRGLLVRMAQRRARRFANTADDTADKTRHIFPSFGAHLFPRVYTKPRANRNRVDCRSRIF